MPDADLIERELSQQYPHPSAAATERARAAVMQTARELSRPAGGADARRPWRGRLFSSTQGDRRRWRPVLVGVAILVALALVGVGIAAGFGAFEGTPAPPDVSTNFTQLNKMADAAIQQGISLKWPQVDASKAHGVIEIQTPDGPEDLWAAPNDQGGQCFFIDWANDPPGQDGSKYGFGGGCGSSSPPPASSTPPASSNISFGDVWIVGHPDLMTVWGTVHVDAATVQITLDDGSTVTLPVVEHAFLGSLPKGTKFDKVAAFDAAGNQVAERTLLRQ